MSTEALPVTDCVRAKAIDAFSPFHAFTVAHAFVGGGVSGLRPGVPARAPTGNRRRYVARTVFRLSRAGQPPGCGSGRPGPGRYSAWGRACGGGDARDACPLVCTRLCSGRVINRGGGGARPCNSDSECAPERLVQAAASGSPLGRPVAGPRPAFSCGRVRPRKTRTLGPQARKRPDPGRSRRLADSRPDSANARLPAWHPACNRRWHASFRRSRPPPSLLLGVGRLASCSRGSPYRSRSHGSLRTAEAPERPLTSPGAAAGKILARTPPLPYICSRRLEAPAGEHSTSDISPAGLCSGRP